MSKGYDKQYKFKDIKHKKWEVKKMNTMELLTLTSAATTFITAAGLILMFFIRDEKKNNKEGDLSGKKEKIKLYLTRF